MSEPNGERVTMRDLKASLYDLDVGLGQRFTVKVWYGLDDMNKRLIRTAQLLSAAVLGFGSIVEFAHFRHYEKTGNKHRMVFTLTAAIACAYMSSEALTGDWPSW